MVNNSFFKSTKKQNPILVLKKNVDRLLIAVAGLQIIIKNFNQNFVSFKISFVYKKNFISKINDRENSFMKHFYYCHFTLFLQP